MAKAAISISFLRTGDLTPQDRLFLFSDYDKDPGTEHTNILKGILKTSMETTAWENWALWDIGDLEETSQKEAYR